MPQVCVIILLHYSWKTKLLDHFSKFTLYLGKALNWSIVKLVEASIRVALGELIEWSQLKTE